MYTQEPKANVAAPVTLAQFEAALPKIVGRIIPQRTSWLLIVLAFATMGCSSAPDATQQVATRSGTSAHQDDGRTGDGGQPVATFGSTSAPASGKTLSPETRTFLREARTMANMALAHEYGAFTRGWDGLAYKAAAAGLAVEPNNEAAQVYQSLRRLRKLVDVYADVLSKTQTSSSQFSAEYRRLLNEMEPVIEDAAREALEWIKLADE